MKFSLHSVSLKSRSQSRKLVLKQKADKLLLPFFALFGLSYVVHPPAEGSFHAQLLLGLRGASDVEN